MRIDLASVPSEPHRPNEDFAAAALSSVGTSGAAVVLDGVTPPPDGVTGCVHDVPWFTTRLGNALLQLARSSPGDALADCLGEAVSRTVASHGPACDLSHVRTPQATVVALRWDAEHLEYLVLSDSALLLEGTDGTVTPVLETRLDDIRLRPEVRALRERIAELPEGREERAVVVRSLADAVEGLRNAEGGFFTAAADPGVGRYAVTGVRPRAELRSVAALTDGATRWNEVFRLGDWDGLLAVLKKEGAHGLVEQVRAAESEDSECRAFPRGKPYDDASALYVEL